MLKTSIYWHACIASICARAQPSTDVTKQVRLQNALAELNVLSVAAQKALTEAEDGIWFDSHDLAGLPYRILSKLKRREVSSGEEFFVTFGNEHRMSLMRYATREATRRRMYTASQHRFPDNVTRLARIVELRDEIARLLGFANHAALKMEEKMASSVAEVEERLRELKTTAGTTS
jgi:metallopeptidase MepB